jgi:ubiquinone/menaquinone biosynthesis C-methylase UbiE
VRGEGDSAQERITSFWNVVGPGYNTPDNVAAPGSPEYAAWREAIRSVLPGEPCDLLDVGTGTGFVARIAAELGHRVTGVDLSDGMLDSAREELGKAGLQVSLLVGDAVSPPFPAESFDVVISRSVLWTLREPDTAFENWHTLLRPRGQVVAIYGLADHTTDEPDQAEKPTRDPAGLFQQAYTSQTRALLPAMQLTDHDPLLQIAEQAGFVEVTTSPLTMVRGWETSPGSDQPYALVGRRPDQR